MNRLLRWRVAQTAELLWWKHYLRNRNITEYLQWKKEYWLNFLEKIELKEIDIPTNKVVDLGCGPAGIFIIFKNAQIEAADPLINEYEYRLPHFKKEFYPNVVFHQTSIELFLPNTTFNYVFCINAINHVNNLQLCFDNLVASVSDRHTIVISIDAHKYSLLKNIFRFFQADILHPHQYDLAEYKEMLVRRGCSIVREYLYKKGTIFNYYVLVVQRKL